MTSRKLKTTIGEMYPLVYSGKLLIEKDDIWKKGLALDIDYDVENKPILMTEKGMG